LHSLSSEPGLLLPLALPLLFLAPVLLQLLLLFFQVGHVPHGLLNQHLVVCPKHLQLALQSLHLALQSEELGAILLEYRAFGAQLKDRVAQLCQPCLHLFCLQTRQVSVLQQLQLG
jgi:hypothetical protein